MPKGKKNRSQAEYNREIEDAIKRFRKYPERITASEDSEEWINFLKGIGIHEGNINKGSDFWESVREGVYSATHEVKDSIPIVIQLVKEFDNRKVYIETTWSYGTQYREVYTDHKVIYRDMNTGRFTKRYGKK